MFISRIVVLLTLGLSMVASENMRAETNKGPAPPKCPKKFTIYEVATLGILKLTFQDYIYFYTAFRNIHYFRRRFFHFRRCRWHRTSIRNLLGQNIQGNKLLI